MIKEISAINGVSETRAVYGEFDVFIRLEVGDLAIMDEIVTHVR